jgi:hypothetical protein
LSIHGLLHRRADGAGPRARRRLSIRRAILCAGVLGLTIAITGCGASQHRPRAASPAPSAGYGSLPSFLPTASFQPDSVLTGSAARPALTTEGDGVRVSLPGAAVLATVSGPVVPGEGLPFQAPATTCTWTVTLSDASADVAIVVADFSTLDHLGVVYQVNTVPGMAAPPAMMVPGQTATFMLRAVMPTGEGLLRWAPGGQNIVASWDFEVEND